MNIYFYFFVIIILAICILGLQTRSTELSSNIRTESIENFQTSSPNQVNTGSSTFYDWGLYGQNNRLVSDDNEDEEMPVFNEEESSVCSRKKPKQPKKKDCTSCNSGKTSVENNYYVYEKDKPSPCSTCDLTRHPDINKYVLETSVPPCPDMSKYAPKSMINNIPDMRDYIKKSEIPACPPKTDLSNYIKKSEVPSCPSTPDMSKYVLKSSIPAAPECPTCPVCPLCPVCPSSYKNVENDPRFKTWIIKYKEEQSRILHREFIRRDTCTKDSQVDYTKGYKSGKDSAYKQLASELGTEVKQLKREEKPGMQNYQELLGRYEEMRRENQQLLNQINKRKRQTEIIIRNEKARRNPQTYNQLKQEQEEQMRVQEEQRQGMGIRRRDVDSRDQTRRMGGMFVTSNRRRNPQQVSEEMGRTEEEESRYAHYLGNNGAYSTQGIKNCN